MNAATFNLLKVIDFRKAYSYVWRNHKRYPIVIFGPYMPYRKYKSMSYKRYNKIHGKYNIILNNITENYKQKQYYFICG